MGDSERPFKRYREDQEHERAISEGKKYYCGPGDYPTTLAQHCRQVRNEADVRWPGRRGSSVYCGLTYFGDEADEIISRAKEHLLKSASSGSVGSDISYEEALLEGQPGMEEYRSSLAKAVKEQLASRSFYAGVVCTTRSGNEVRYGNLIHYLIVTITVPFDEPLPSFEKKVPTEGIF
jgi:hypothetical protein